MACRKEEGAGDGTRPGDVFFPRLNVDGPAAVDVTIRDPLAPSHPVTTAAGIDGWHRAQEMDKTRKCGVACGRLHWHFLLFVVDVWGGFGPEAMTLVHIITRNLVGQKEGWQRREAEAGIWQDLSFAAMREVMRQLVWGVLAVDGPEHDPTTHSPYL